MIGMEILDAEELLVLARIDMERKQMDSALVKLKNAVKLNEEMKEISSTLATLYAQVGMFERAANIYSEILEKEPESVWERFQYGMVQRDLGNVDAALSSWKKVLELDKTHPPALFFCAEAELKNNEEEARRYLDILVQSTAADNLYVEKAKELLIELNKEKRPEVN